MAACVGNDRGLSDALEQVTSALPDLKLNEMPIEARENGVVRYAVTGRDTATSSTVAPNEVHAGATLAMRNLAQAERLRGPQAVRETTRAAWHAAAAAADQARAALEKNPGKCVNRIRRSLQRVEGQRQRRCESWQQQALKQRQRERRLRVEQRRGKLRRERQAREDQARERQEQERQAREQRLRVEQQAREQQARERQARERQAQERQEQEWQAREQQRSWLLLQHQSRKQCKALSQELSRTSQELQRALQALEELKQQQARQQARHETPFDILENVYDYIGASVHASTPTHARQLRRSWLALPRRCMLLTLLDPSDRDQLTNAAAWCGAFHVKWSALSRVDPGILVHLNDLSAKFEKEGGLQLSMHFLGVREPPQQSAVAEGLGPVVIDALTAFLLNRKDSYLVGFTPPNLGPNLDPLTSAACSLLTLRALDLSNLDMNMPTMEKLAALCRAPGCQLRELYLPSCNKAHYTELFTALMLNAHSTLEVLRGSCASERNRGGLNLGAYVLANWVGSEHCTLRELDFRGLRADVHLVSMMRKSRLRTLKMGAPLRDAAFDWFRIVTMIRSDHTLNVSLYLDGEHNRAMELATLWRAAMCRKPQYRATPKPPNAVRLTLLGVPRAYADTTWYQEHASAKGPASAKLDFV